MRFIGGLFVIALVLFTSCKYHPFLKSECDYNYDRTNIFMRYSEANKTYKVFVPYSELGRAFIRINDVRDGLGSTFTDSCKAKAFIKEYIEQQTEYK